MSASFRLGSLFGISILVHYSWFIVFALVTFSLVADFSGQFPTQSDEVHWVMGIVTSALFFGSVLFHEMTHSVVALTQKIRVRSITLFIFGGVAEIEDEPDRPRTEILIAVVGPLASLSLAIFFGVIWFLTANALPVIGGMAGWLAKMNAGLGIFNLLPGMPLDGGRILRGIGWYISGSFTRATRISSMTGRFLGYLIITTGIWMAFGEKRMADGIWLGFIGWFLVNAAEMTMMQAQLHRAIAGVRVSQVMSTDCTFVPPGVSLSEFVMSYLMQSAARCFIVGDQTAPRGIITISDVRAIPRDEWNVTSVQSAMRPMEKVISVSPEIEVQDVLRLMDTKNVAQVPVRSEGRLVGIVGRENLLSLIRNRMELGFQFREEGEDNPTGNRWIGA
jgi:Zn-dependent protease